MKTPENERRLRGYAIPEHEVFNLICKRWHMSPNMSVHFIDCVPEDAEVVHVSHDTYRRCFIFLLRSSEFDEVPFPSPYPVEDKMQLITVTFRMTENDNNGWMEQDAYSSLRKENEDLRRIARDAITDDAKLEATYLQGRRDESAALPRRARTL